jgi:hypothetical protein
MGRRSVIRLREPEMVQNLTPGHIMMNASSALEIHIANNYLDDTMMTPSKDVEVVTTRKRCNIFENPCQNLNRAAEMSIIDYKLNAGFKSIPCHFL